MEIKTKYNINDMAAIYAIRDYQIIRYDIIDSDENTYSLRDTSCKTHDNCEIRISRKELDDSGSYNVGENVEFLNDSAVSYKYFHIGLIFFLDETDAKIEVENRWINAYKELLNNEITLRDRLQKAISDLKNYMKNIPNFTEKLEIGYGSHIFAYDINKVTDETCKVYNGQTLSVEEALRNSIYDFTINNVSEIVRTRNGVITKKTEMFADNREDEDSLNEYEIYLKVENVNGKIELSRMSYYDDYEIEYCKGTRIFHEGYKTIYECEKVIINEIFEKYDKRMVDNLKSITKYEGYLKEHEEQLKGLEQSR
jgi:hypothetical protein